MDSGGRCGPQVAGPQSVRVLDGKVLGKLRPTRSRRDPHRVSSRGAEGWKSWSCLLPDRETEAVAWSTFSGCKARAEALCQKRALGLLPQALQGTCWLPELGRLSEG